MALVKPSWRRGRKEVTLALGFPFLACGRLRVAVLRTCEICVTWAFARCGLGFFWVFTGLGCSSAGSTAISPRSSSKGRSTSGGALPDGELRFRPFSIVFTIPPGNVAWEHQCDAVSSCLVATVPLLEFPKARLFAGQEQRFPATPASSPPRRREFISVAIFPPAAFPGFHQLRGSLRGGQHTLAHFHPKLVLFGPQFPVQLDAVRQQRPTV